MGFFDVNLYLLINTNNIMTKQERQKHNKLYYSRIKRRGLKIYNTLLPVELVPLVEAYKKLLMTQYLHNKKINL